MDPREFTLTFTGPFALAGDRAPLLFADPIAEKSGLYLWAVPSDRGGMLVVYVGETRRSFGARMKEHGIQILGGNYRVSDAGRLRQGKDDVVWDGLWRKGTRHLLPEFVDGYVKLAPVIREYLLTMQFLVAPCPADDVRALRRIEAAIARHIWSQPAPASSLLPRDNRYVGRRDANAPIRVHVSSQGAVLGLPVTLEA